MDLMSLHLLLYILERLEQLSGVVVLLTSRPEDMDGVQLGASTDDPVAAARHGLLREVVTYAQTSSANVLNLKLHGLDRRESNQLVARVLGCSDEELGVDKSVLSFIFKKTEGYPMYLTLLIEWIKERGLLVKNDQGVFVWVSKDTPSTAQFPNSLADTMITRLDRLDPQGRNLIKIASVLGVEFDAIGLTALADLDRTREAGRGSPRAGPGSATGGGTAAGAATQPLTEKDTLKTLDEAKKLGILVVNSANKSIKKTAHRWRFIDSSVQLAVLRLVPEARIRDLQRSKKEMLDMAEKKKLSPLFAGFLGEVDDDGA